ncbi:nucleoside hydrolase [Sphingomonas tabacisoli]|uniref:Nucleoside hydrolase n=1 Tax=Sphingomonas tabacisoli TaxID=2249466 RepID=A0ABW4I315_9SPHN
MIVCNRRLVIGGALSAAAFAAAESLASPLRMIPQKAASRVIVDNDFAGDPDGLVALTHQLLAPKTRVVLVTSSLLDPKFSAGEFPNGMTAAAGANTARELIERLKLDRPVQIAAGREKPSSTVAAATSPAARAIVAEAMRDDPLPLVFTCGGPLTNLAEALALEPRIAGRMSLVWIGGGSYPEGGWEYNLATDVEAARVVIGRSTMPVLQVPQSAYRQMQISVAELEADVRATSDFGAWLYDRFTNPPSFIDVGGAWPMGDTPLVLATALPTESSRIRAQPARRIKDDCSYGEEIAGRTIRVFEAIDVRLAWADFVARLRLHTAGR